MRVRVQNDWWWHEEMGTPGQDYAPRGLPQSWTRVFYLGDSGHPCRWLAPVCLPTGMRWRYPDKLWHVGATLALSLLVGPLWALLAMTAGLEFVFPALYDPDDMRVGVWDILANAAGALAAYALGVR